MRKRIFLLLLGFLLLIVPQRAGAQQDVSFTALQIDLWPEYDRPEMLVVYRGVLSPEVQLPAMLTFRIPAAAGEPNAVAERTEGQPLLNVEYTREVQGEWALIRFTATMPIIQLEYYDPGLQKDGVDRAFEYRWPGDYDVDQLLVIVQQPTGATAMETIPRLSEVLQNPSDGIIYHSAELGAFKAGETFDLTINYQKESDALTVEFLPVLPAEPVSPDTPGRVSLVNILPWGIGLLGVIIIAAGLYWYWVTGEKRTQPNVRPHKARKQIHTISDEQEIQDDSVFCHQCGKRAAPGDRFCRACGTKLRV